MDMTLAMAERAVSAAQAKARELGTPITVTVVDEAGRLVLCARGDGTAFLTPDTSRGKAVAAAAFRRSTKELVELAKEHPAFWNALPTIAPGQLLPSTGAVPISRGRPRDRRDRLRRGHRRAGSPVRLGGGGHRVKHAERRAAGRRGGSRWRDSTAPH